MPATTSQARTRGATRARPAARRKPARRPGGGRGSGYREIAGLGLVALGGFLGAVVFAGVGGGAFGRYLEEGLRVFVGRGVGLAPLVMVAVGIHLIVRIPVFDSRPFRVGAGLAGLAILLGLASGLFGEGMDPVSGWPDIAAAKATGGMIGGGLWWAAAGTIGSVGANILTVLGIAAGMVLMSGASLGEALRGSGRGVATAGAAVGRGVASATGTAVRGATRAGGEARAIARTVAAPTTRRDEDAHDAPVAVEAPDDPHPVPGPADHHRGAAFDDGAHDVFDDPIDGDAADDAVPAPDAFTPVELPSAPAPAAGDEGIHGPPGTLPRGGWKRPARTSLRTSGGVSAMPVSQVRDTSRRLLEALAEFGVEAEMVNAVSGPRVTRYELRLAPGTKVSKVSSLRDDLAYALAATDELRILAPIPGKQAVGVEVPNPDARIVTLGDVWRDFPDDTGPLAAWLGLDIGGKAVFLDVARMPHLLIAGSTGTGKSVCLNALLASILLRATPDDLRLVMIDPKKVELNHYEGIPHLLTPVVTNMKSATAVLANIVREMEARYELMGAARARNLRDWNGIRRGQGLSEVPHVLVVIDELADLMMVAPGEVEDAIIRIAQKARAVGIHLLLATQRPSVDVITGMIKANVPSRIAFAVSSQVDSRVVLDSGGAESLLGNGDMLFRPVGSSRLQRLQGAYVSEAEILAITDHWRGQGAPEMRDDLLERAGGDEPEVDPGADEMLRVAVDTVVQQGSASVSLLQRRLGIGYARAGRLVDSLERLGVISGHEGSKPRTVLIGEADVARVLGGAAAGDDGATGAQGDDPAGR